MDDRKLAKLNGKVKEGRKEGRKAVLQRSNYDRRETVEKKMACYVRCRLWKIKMGHDGARRDRVETEMELRWMRKYEE